MSSVNHSTARQKYSFAKTKRFQAFPVDVNEFTTTCPSIFGNDRRAQRSFNVTQSRWGHHQQAKPDQPFGHDIKPPASVTNQSFSFGISRGQMKKQFIDKIQDQIRRGEASPAPIAYQTNVSKFMSISPISHGFQMKYKDNEKRLKLSSEMPGPDQYSSDWSKTLKNNFDSKYPNQPVAKFGTCKKFIDTQRNGSPSPDRYSPNIGFTQSVIWQRAASPKIGKGTIDIIDQSFGIKEARTKPGPGRYEVYTEFC